MSCLPFLFRSASAPVTAPVTAQIQISAKPPSEPRRAVVLQLDICHFTVLSQARPRRHSRPCAAAVPPLLRVARPLQKRGSGWVGFAACVAAALGRGGPLWYWAGLRQGGMTSLGFGSRHSEPEWEGVSRGAAVPPPAMPHANTRSRRVDSAVTARAGHGALSRSMFGASGASNRPNSIAIHGQRKRNSLQTRGALQGSTPAPPRPPCALPVPPPHWQPPPPA